MDFWTEEQMRSIDKMLNPRSIAVVGASPKGGYGGRLFDAVLKSKDRVRIYPVNPNYQEIKGLKSYPSIGEIPEAPDLVGVVVPYDKVLDVLQESLRKGAGSAVVISAGFAERGVESRLELQQKIGAFARESGVRMAGPNCLGLANDVCLVVCRRARLGAHVREPAAGSHRAARCRAPGPERGGNEGLLG